MVGEAGKQGREGLPRKEQYNGERRKQIPSKKAVIRCDGWGGEIQSSDEKARSFLFLANKLSLFVERDAFFLLLSIFVRSIFPLFEPEYMVLLTADS